MIEQPASSRLPWFPRFERMLEKIPVFRVGWWMRHYGGLTPNLSRSISEALILIVGRRFAVLLI